MKNNLIIAGLAIAAMCSCQKEITADVNTISGNEGVRYSFTVSDEALVRSSYIAGEGVKLNGNENIAMFYATGASFVASTEGFTKAIMGEDDHKNVPLKATGTNFSYSFTAPAGSEDCTKWFAIVPYARTLVLADTLSTANIASVRIHSVQYPEGASFDPHYDFLAAKPIEFTSTGNNTYNGEIKSFKRLSAPFRIVVKGLDADELIHAATIRLSENATGKNGLSGKFNVILGDDADDTAVLNSSAIGNGVTAIYPDGLAAENGQWNVWYCVNPTKLVAGEELTLTVTTGTKTITRTVTLPSDSAISAEKLSQITINAKGSGYSEENSILYDFSNADVKTISSPEKAYLVEATGSNGISTNWFCSSSSCVLSDQSNPGKPEYYDGGAGLPKGIQVSVSTGTNKWFRIPTIEGKKITKIGVYAHTRESKLVAGVYTSNEKAAREPIASADMIAARYSDGGYAEISLPDGYNDFSGLYLQGSGTGEFAAVKLFINGEAEEIDKNDYYTLFDNGHDIVINGVAYNKNDVSTYSRVPMGDVETATFSQGKGIIFLDDSGEVKSFTSTSSISFAKGLVVIGRYRNSQPTLSTATGNCYFSSTENLILKNLHLVAPGAAAFNTNKSAEVSITCEDCEIEVEKHLLRESNAGNHFKDVTFNNCIIVNGDTSYGLVASSSAAKGEIGKEGSITITNSVVMTKPKDNEISYLDRNIIDLTAGTDSVKTVITLKNNSFIGFNGATGGAALVNTKTIGGIDIEKCLFYGNWAAGKTNRLFKTTTVQNWLPSVVKFLDNGAKNATAAMSATNGDTQKFMNPVNIGIPVADKEKMTSLSIPSKDNTGHLWKLEDDMFSTMDCTNFYFPVNRTVVTNGAGADYSTKLWKAWVK